MTDQGVIAKKGPAGHPVPAPILRRHDVYAPAVLISETNVFNLTNQEL